MHRYLDHCTVLEELVFRGSRELFLEQIKRGSWGPICRYSVCETRIEFFQGESGVQDVSTAVSDSKSK